MTTPYERIVTLINEHVRYQEEDYKTSGLIQFARALEAEIAAKTCANCQHYVQPYAHAYFCCDNIKISDMIQVGNAFGTFEPPADFACNRYEEKK